MEHQFQVASKPYDLSTSVFNINDDIKLVEGLLELVPLQQKQVQLKFFLSW
jgi:hypothetical protein